MERESVVSFLRKICHNVDDRGELDIMVSCPFAPYNGLHKKKVDRKPSMGILPKPQEYMCLAHCFTCGFKSKSLTWMVEQLATYDPDFEKFIPEVEELERFDLDEALTSLWGYGQLTAPKRAKQFDQHSYEPFRGIWHSYHEERGYNRETFDVWELGYNEDNKRVTFPVYDVKKQLVGMIGRGVDKAVQPKYWNYWGFDESFFLYGEHLIKPGTDIVVVEGPVDVTKGWQNIQHLLEEYSIVGCMGGVLSDRQCDKLVQYGAGIVLAFDADDSGARFFDHAVEKLERRSLLQVIDYSVVQGKDPDTWGDSFSIAIENARMVM